MIVDLENISLTVWFDKICFKDWIWSIIYLFCKITVIWKINRAEIILKKLHYLQIITYIN